MIHLKLNFEVPSFYVHNMKSLFRTTGALDIRRGVLGA